MCIVLMLIVNNCFGQVQVEMPNWYNYYASVFHQNPNVGLERPSLFSSQLYKKAAEEKTIQFVLIESDQELNNLSLTERERMGFETSSNSGGNVIVSTLGIIVPNLHYVWQDGLVNVQFNSTDFFSSLPNRNRMPSVRSIQITSQNGTIATLVKGEVVKIVYESFFDNNLNLTITYENGSIKTLPIRIIEKPTIFGPNDFNPQNPLDNGDDHGFVALNNLPPPFTECSSANYQDTIISDLSWDGHPLNSSFSTPEWIDYLLHYGPGNPGVFEGENSVKGELIASYYINPIHNKITKPIILVDGIDFDSSRDSEELLEMLGGEKMLLTLFDAGYDLVIADFKGGADFIQKNALALIELIRKLNKDDLVEEIPAILGPSMGGQVVRYALMHWEQNLINDAKYGDYNIPLFVSIDSPWLGANAPPAAIYAAQCTKDEDDQMKLLDIMVNGPAARQMLIHHCSQEKNIVTSSISPLFHYYKGSPHLWGEEFYNQLKIWDDYPNKTKIVATANGSNDGFSIGTGTGYYVPPGKKIFEVDTDWKGIDIFAQDIHVRSIEEGSSLVKTPLCDDLGTLSAVIDKIDSAPGSGFDLELLVNNHPDVTIHSSFCFIPTFSALGIEAGLTDPYMPTAGVQSDYFSATYSNDHNDFHMTFGPEKSILGADDGINFILDQMNYFENIGEGLSPCESLDYFYQNGGGFLSENVESDFHFEMDVSDNAIYPNFLIGNLDLCVNDLVMALEPTIDISLTNNDCNLGLNWSSIYNEPIIIINDPTIFDYTMPSCNLTTSICLSLPECPNFYCEIVDWEIDFNMINQAQGNSNSGILVDNENPNALFEGRQEFDNSFFKELKIYPNPSSGLINLEMLDGQNQVEVYTIDGRLVSKETHDVQGSTIEKTLERGTYIIRVTNENTQEIEVKRIVVL